MFQVGEKVLVQSMWDVVEGLFDADGTTGLIGTVVDTTYQERSEDPGVVVEFGGALWPENPEPSRGWFHPSELSKLLIDPFETARLWQALVAWRWKEKGSCSNLKHVMREVCLHTHVKREDYINPCANAGCELNGPVTYHLNCGSQWREVCADCGTVLYDSADEPVEMEPVEYICRQCQADGIQPGHWACGTTFYVPQEERDQK